MYLAHAQELVQVLSGMISFHGPIELSSQSLNFFLSNCNDKNEELQKYVI